MQKPQTLLNVVHNLAYVGHFRKCLVCRCLFCDLITTICLIVYRSVCVTRSSYPIDHLDSIY